MTQFFFCSLHWRNLSLYNKITTTNFKQIRFWWKNVIKFRGKVYSNFFKFVQQLFFLSEIWIIEDWKNIAWSDESRFLLRHSDGRVRIWRKEHDSMDPSFLVSTVQVGGGGVMVWGIFSWHTLGPLVPIEQWVHFTQMASTVTRSQSNRAPLGCGGTGDSHHECEADKSAATAWYYHVNMDHNLWWMFPTPCWIYATKN